MAGARVTQQAAEVLYTGTPSARVSQQAVEVLRSVAVDESGVLTAVTRTPMSTSTGTQDITGAFTWTPKAALFFLGTVETDPTGNNARLSVGATDGTRQWCCAVVDANNVSTTDARRQMQDDEVLHLLDLGSGTYAEANFDSFIPGGVRINWGVNAGGIAPLITVVFFGGDDLSVYVSTATLGNVNTNTVVTGVGFQPDLILLSNVGLTVAAGESLNAMLSFGACHYDEGATALRNYCWQYYSRDNVSTSECNGIVHDDRCLGQGSTSEEWTAELVSVASDGFVLTTRGANSNDEIGYLALNTGDRAVKIGAIDSPTATGDWSVTAPGITPQLVLMGMGMQSAYGTYYTNGQGSAPHVSAFTPDAEYCVGLSSEDNQTTTDTQSLADDVAVNLDDHSGGDQFDATFSSMDASGWTLNFTAANGTARKWFYVAIEEEAGATFTATAALTVGGASVSASATHTTPTYTATSTITTGGAEVAASATFTAPTYTATAAFTTAGAELSASGTFTAPVYTSTAALTAGGVELAASATFTAPVYDSTAAVTAGGVELDASATFATATFTATAAVTAGGAELSASGTFTAPVYTGSTALTTAGVTFASSATFVPPSFTATADLNVGGVEFDASASYASAIFLAAAALISGGVEVSASASYDPGTFTATASLVTGGVVPEVAATFTAPVYSAEVAVTVGGAEVSSSASFSPPEFTATSTLITAGVEVNAAASFSPGTKTATASLVTGGVEFTASVVFESIVTPPYVYGTIIFTTVTGATLVLDLYQDLIAVNTTISATLVFGDESMVATQLANINVGSENRIEMTFKKSVSGVESTWDLSGSTVTMTLESPDRSTQTTHTMTASDAANGVYYYDLTDTDVTVVGYWTCSFTITVGSKTYKYQEEVGFLAVDNP